MDPDTPKPTGPLLAEFAHGYPFELDSHQLEACGHIEAGSGVPWRRRPAPGRRAVWVSSCVRALAQGRKCFYDPDQGAEQPEVPRSCGKARVGGRRLLTGDTSINGDAQVVG